MRRKEWGPRRLSPALRGGKGSAGSPRAPQFGPPEGGRGARGWGDWGGGEGSRFHVAKTCLSGRGLSWKARLAQPYVFPSSLAAASRQREEVSSAYMKVCEMVMGVTHTQNRIHKSREALWGEARALGGTHAGGRWGPPARRRRRFVRHFFFFARFFTCFSWEFAVLAAMLSRLATSIRRC